MNRIERERLGQRIVLPPPPRAEVGQLWSSVAEGGYRRMYRIDQILIFSNSRWFFDSSSPTEEKIPPKTKYFCRQHFTRSGELFYDPFSSWTNFMLLDKDYKPIRRSKWTICT